MNTETIEKAARERLPHSKETCSLSRYALGKNVGFLRGFMSGARWRIDSVWHDKHTVIPEVGRTALLELRDPNTHKIVYKIDTYCGEEWRELTHYEYSGLVRFAYLDDLLPQ